MLPAMPHTPVSLQDAGVVVSAKNCANARFPPTARVRAKAEFSRVFDAGKRVAEPCLALHWLTDANRPRLGLAVSRKVDKRAVGRNRIKRVMRETFRKLRPQLRGGAYVIVARVSAAKISNEALQIALQRVLQRAGALPPATATGTMPPATSLPSP